MTMEFRVARQSGEWFYEDSRLTEQEAMIIAVAGLAGDLKDIAKSLAAVASAIEDASREIREAAPPNAAK